MRYPDYRAADVEPADAAVADARKAAEAGHAAPLERATRRTNVVLHAPAFHPWTEGGPLPTDKLRAAYGDAAS
jgi:hypothetical protein